MAELKEQFPKVRAQIYPAHRHFSLANTAISEKSSKLSDKRVSVCVNYERVTTVDMSDRLCSGAIAGALSPCLCVRFNSKSSLLISAKPVNQVCSS